MTTVGYGEIYPVTGLGRFFTIISAIVGIFINSLLTVALTEVTELSEEQSDAFDEICGSNTVKKKLRYDAAIFIQNWFRHWKIQRKPKQTEVKERLYARFRFVTAKNTFAFKHKSFTNDIPTLDEVFETVNDLSSKYADKFYRKCYKIKSNIIPKMEDCTDYQYEIDTSFLKLYDLTQKCYSFLCQIEESEYGNYELPQYESIEDVDDYYDTKKKRGDGVVNFRNYKLRLNDARAPISDLYDGI